MSLKRQASMLALATATAGMMPPPPQMRQRPSSRKREAETPKIVPVEVEREVEPTYTPAEKTAMAAEMERLKRENPNMNRAQRRKTARKNILRARRDQKGA